MTSVVFVTMADAEHAVGVVALVNSLRLQGHHEPVTVLDLGLTPAQRALLAGECSMTAAPSSPTHPWLLIPAACLAAVGAADATPSVPEVVVYLDSDQIVTGSLEGVIAEARAGRICTFVDPMPDRWFGEWADSFALAAPLRREPYVNAGFVAFSVPHHESFVRRWADRCAEMEGHAIEITDIAFDDPCALPDQDALNAMLMSELPPEACLRHPGAQAAQGIAELAATRVVDPRRLVCERAGTTTLLLHSFGAPKPWQPPARRDLHRSAYLLLLRRLLTDPALAVPAPGEVVPWLRPGLRGAAVLRLLTISDRLRTRTRGARERIGLVSRSSARRRPSP